MSPNEMNYKLSAGQFQWRSEMAQKVINSEAPAKAKRNPWEGISRDFHSQGRSELEPKGSNSESPSTQILWSVQFPRRPKLSPKGINYEVPAAQLCANGVWNWNMILKLQVQGKIYQDTKKRISLCTANFSSETTKWKEDGRLLWC